MTKKGFLLLAIVMLPVASVQSQEHEASIADFAFFTGYWKGSGFGGTSEEMWMPHSAGNLLGTFKQSDGDALIFSEYMEIVKVDGEFQLRLKHFNPDFSGWEEKSDHVIFKLVEVSENKAVFEGLIYELIAPDQLQVTLQLQDSDGNSSAETFSYSRHEL